MDALADVEVVLHLLPTDMGGRAEPCRAVARSWRPLLDMGRTDGLNGALVEFVGTEWASPGDTVRARMWFMSPQLQHGRLFEGMTFAVHEAQPVIAHGRIEKVLNAAMRKTT